jgi:Uncharacterized conserved protein (DUF2163)
MPERACEQEWYGGGYFTAELRGLSQALAQNTLQLYGPDCRADLGNARCRFPLWPEVVARGTAYLAGQFVRSSNPPGGTNASDFDDRIYECTSAGITHATVQPTYDMTVGTTTTDGTAVFTVHRARGLQSRRRGGARRQWELRCSTTWVILLP